MKKKKKKNRWWMRRTFFFFTVPHFLALLSIKSVGLHPIAVYDRECYRYYTLQTHRCIYNTIIGMYFMMVSLPMFNATTPSAVHPIVNQLETSEWT